MDFLILLYPDGHVVALDHQSGGYPYRTTRVDRANVWETEEARTRYQEMFVNENFKKATLRMEIINIKD